MKPHEERVVAEKAELDKKLDALNVFVDGQVFLTLPEEDQQLLVDQLATMQRYNNLLAARIARFPKESTSAPTITLVEKPLMKLQCCQDGVWLYFRTSDGNSAGVNLVTAFSGSSLSDRVIREWCLEYANLHHP